MKIKLIPLLLVMPSAIFSQTTYYTVGRLKSDKVHAEKSVYSPYVKATNVETDKILWVEHDDLAIPKSIKYSRPHSNYMTTN